MDTEVTQTEISRKMEIYVIAHDITSEIYQRLYVSRIRRAEDTPAV